ncbi:MAG: SDR family oxidoreductase [Spirochaetaceae bacterium]|nr:SDR family oxidoreductase [Myxococcales bacterium]MCB9722640.1 SDR family oxidoreductase [Spirochaetaceae bacterium]HPG27052.1 SDR family oxidoreductase [Myxococcota bacterium]
MTDAAFRLDGRIAIVTGAGRGVGKGIALSLAEAGATVLCAARTATEVASTAREIEANGGKALSATCDVTDPDQCAQLIDRTVAECGGIDVLVNNAGGGGHRPTARLTTEFLVKTHELNLFAAVHLSRLASDSLRARSGSIINISSGMGKVSEANCIAYASAKAGLEQATRNLACELAPDVRVNALRLGAIVTPDFERLVEAVPGIDVRLAHWTPLKRLGTPRDVGLACVYLAAPAGSFVTGSVLDIDGGIQMPRGAMTMMDVARTEPSFER